MMELKIFKKHIHGFLTSKNFLKRGNYYCLFFKDLTIVIGLQKSSYSNGYYINLGYIISSLNPGLLKPRDVDGNVRSRFSLQRAGKEIDFFDLEILSEEELKSALENNMKEYIDNITSAEELKDLIEKKPVMLYQTGLTAKKLFGFV